MCDEGTTGVKMELGEFVNQTLSQIVHGIGKAQGSTVHRNGINPTVAVYNKTNALMCMSDDGRWIKDVEFDVAVTTEDVHGSKKGLGIFVASIGAGIQGTSEQKSVIVSRIKFSVPVVYPKGR